MFGRDERGDRRDLERRAERREDLHSPLGSRDRGDDGAARAAIDALPPELSRQSLSTTALILPLDPALLAIERLTATGRRLDAWEGWVKMRDGGRARSLAHAGSFALPADAARAASTAGDGMRRAQERWNRDPEYPGAELYFGLTFSRIT